MLTTASAPTRPAWTPMSAEFAATPVSSVMRPGVVTVPGNASLTQVVKAMSAHRVHAVLVVRSLGSSPHGWVTSDALLERLLDGGAIVRASDAVTEPPTYIAPSATVADAVRALAAPGVSHLLVTMAPAAAPQGVLSDTDLVRFAAGWS